MEFKINLERISALQESGMYDDALMYIYTKIDLLKKLIEHLGTLEEATISKKITSGGYNNVKNNKI